MDIRHYLMINNSILKGKSIFFISLYEIIGYYRTLNEFKEKINFFEERIKKLEQMEKLPNDVFY